MVKVTLRQAPLTVLLLIGMLAGCRTYGGYGTEEATLDEVVQAVDTYENMLAQARTILATLEEQAQTDPAADPFVQQFEAVVAGHTVLLEKQREQLVTLAGSDDYRRVSRVLGAVLSEQQLTRRQYGEVMRYTFDPSGAAGRLVVWDDSTARMKWSRVTASGSYYIVPPYYERARQSRFGTFTRPESRAGSEGRTAPSDSLG